MDAFDRLFVLDGSHNEVRLFDASGRHVRTFGRMGSGPGEFRNAAGLLSLDSVVVVSDAGNARYSVFDTSGALIETRPRSVPHNLGGRNVWIGSDGTIYDAILHRGPGMARSMTVLVRTTLADPSRDTIPVPLPQVADLEVRVSGGVTRIPIPYGPEAAWWVDARRGHIWTGRTDEFRITQTNFSGDTLLIVERQFDPVQISAAERQKAIEEYAQGGYQVAPSVIPRHKPAYSAFAVDDEGYLWVRTVQASGNGFDVFDPKGYYLGSVRIPAELVTGAVALHIGRDALYGVVRDSAGVEYLARLGIRGR